MNGCHAKLPHTHTHTTSRGGVDRVSLAHGAVPVSDRLRPPHLVLCVHFDPALEQELHSLQVLASDCVVESRSVVLAQAAGLGHEFNSKTTFDI